MKALTETEKREREQAILRAATRVMEERGLDALTMDEVAHTAGLAKGTLFLYYRSKEELILAAFASMADAFGAELRRLAGADLAPEALLDGAILALISHFDKKRDITGYSGGLPLAGPRRETLRARFAGNMDALADILRRCAAGGLLELEDPLFAASALFGLCRGSTSYARAFGRRLPAAERARRVRRIFLEGTRKGR